MSPGRWLAAVALAIGLIVVAATNAGRSPSPRAPSPPPPGVVLWKADAELPPALEWASSRAESAGGAGCDDSIPADRDSPRIERSRSVVAQGLDSYRITAQPGDECDGERAELGQGNPGTPAFADRLFQSGQDRYISFQLQLAPNFDVNVDAWRVVAQLHQSDGGGPPPLSLDVERGQFILYRSDSDDTEPLWSAPATTGRWIRFTMHVRFSADPEDGLVELWGNPAGGDVVRLLDGTSTATMKTDEAGNPLPDHARIGIYRNPEGPFGTETVYYDGYTVATSRAAAEASAFAPPAQ